jgi:hypothetical protein
LIHIFFSKFKNKLHTCKVFVVYYPYQQHGAAEKNLKKVDGMNGTEKQVSYAKSLVEKFVKSAKESLTFKNSGHPDDAAQREELKLVISVLESFSGNAHECIEALAYCSFYDCMDHESCSKMAGYKKFWKFINENTPKCEEVEDVLNTRNHTLAMRRANGEQVDGDLKFGVNLNKYDEQKIVDLRGKCPVCGENATSPLVYSQLMSGCEGQRRTVDNTFQVGFCSQEHYDEYIRGCQS